MLYDEVEEMLMMFTKALAILAASVAVVVASSSASPAYATGATGSAATVSPAVPPPASAVSQEVISEARDELVRAHVPVEVTQEGANTTETFTLEDGTRLSFTSSAAASRLGGGVHSKYGIYIEFNKLDQQALIAGGGVALGAAICAIPAVGWAACAVVGTIIAVATTYIVANGLCGGDRQLRIYVQLLGNPECV